MKKVFLIIFAIFVSMFLGALVYKYMVEKGKIQDGAYVPAQQYVALQSDKDSIQDAMASANETIERMQECCAANNKRYGEEIERLNYQLDSVISSTSTSNVIPFSIIFRKNSVELDETAKEIVRNVAIEMKKNNSTYTLYGYGDYEGSNDFNQIISEARCESVKHALEKQGVSSDRIQTVGRGNSVWFGERTSNVNRRVEIVKNN